MSRWPWLAVSALLLVGCSSGPSVSGGCEVASVEAEIEALIAESRLEVREYESLICEGPWTYVVGKIGEPGGDATQDHFLMRRDGDIWVLKSPESACVDDELPPSIYEAACSAGA